MALFHLELTKLSSLCSSASASMTNEVPEGPNRWPEASQALPGAWRERDENGRDLRSHNAR